MRPDDKRRGPKLKDAPLAWCAKCQSQTRRGSRNRCLPCGVKATTARMQDAEYRLRDNVRQRTRKYKMTAEQYLALFTTQGGRCAICHIALSRTGSETHTDHDRACCPGQRTCGKCVRGLLCRRCNLNLGILEKWAGPYAEAIAAHQSRRAS